MISQEFTAFLRERCLPQQQKAASQTSPNNEIGSAQEREQQAGEDFIGERKATVENAIRALAQETQEYRYNVTDLKAFLHLLIKDQSLSDEVLEVNVNQYNNFTVPKEAIPFGSNHDVFVWVSITNKPSTHLSIQFCHNGVASRRHR